MNALPVPDVLTRDEARSLTDDVKADAAAMWAKLLTLYEGGAHRALGYMSWGDYCAAEFDMGKSRAYQLLDAARVAEALPESTNVERPRSEGVARELVPLRHDPPKLADTWNRVTSLHGPEPTAAQVREVVADVRPPAPAPEPAPATAALEDTVIGREAAATAQVVRYRAMKHFLDAVTATASIPPQLEHLCARILEVDAEQARHDARIAFETWGRVVALLDASSKLRRVQ